MAVRYSRYLDLVKVGSIPKMLSADFHCRVLLSDLDATLGAMSHILAHFQSRPSSAGQQNSTAAIARTGPCFLVPEEDRVFQRPQGCD